VKHSLRGQRPPVPPPASSVTIRRAISASGDGRCARPASGARNRFATAGGGTAASSASPWTSSLEALRCLARPERWLAGPFSRGQERSRRSRLLSWLAWEPDRPRCPCSNRVFDDLGELVRGFRHSARAAAQGCCASGRLTLPAALLVPPGREDVDGPQRRIRSFAKTLQNLERWLDKATDAKAKGYGRRVLAQARLAPDRVHPRAKCNRHVTNGAGAYPAANRRPRTPTRSKRSLSYGSA
jgi:hypothetical protein